MPLSLYAYTPVPAKTETPAAANTVAKPETKSVSGQQPNDFVFRFHRSVQTVTGTETNMVTSPYGVSSLGEMLTLGAAGETQKKLQTIFVPQDGKSKRTTWLRLPENKTDESPITSTNGIWIEKSFSVRQTYTETLRSRFNVSVTAADFEHNNVEECNKINSWVSQSTNNKITKMFDSFDQQTRLVLVNTLNFQGKWAIPFDKTKTKQDKFYGLKNQTSTVPFMQNTLRLNYLKSDKYQTAAIPYSRNQYSMIIVLPNDKISLSEVENTLNETALTKMLNDSTIENIELVLPTFTIESEINLKPVLVNMGAEIIFDRQKAEFTGISETEGLCVDQITQNVIIRVDESGTEAAAGSGAAVVPKSNTSNEAKPINFRADRPFLFLIRDNVNGVPVFTGRYVGK
jgi:serpin B